ncbi:hypothetical protein LCGC14_2801860 [marine sediment metagenome]|uniref:Uncharacterized protein n=1 Tax=marine sediment metagenome TaxID=412755 RepID=A0A0F9BDU9_9ZZZZ
MVATIEREAELRKEHIDTAVKAVVKIEEKWKALCTVDSSNSYTESYFRETNDDDTDTGTYSPIRGVPEFVPFPYVDVKETKVSAVIEKYAATSLISMEAGQYATVPMLQRKIYRIGRKIIYQEDKAIHDAVTVATTGHGNTVAIAVGYEWDSDTIQNRDPVKDILDCVQTLRVDGIDALKGNGKIVLNGQDYTNFISNSKVLNHPTYESGVMQNGQVGKILGMAIVVSEIVTADSAFVLVAKQGMVWKQANALTTVTTVTPGKFTQIDAWERGVFQSQAPNEICKLTNTRKT